MAARAEAIRPRSDAASDSHSRERERDAEAPSRPVIRVSIGRVDVRAVVAPPPARVRRAAPDARRPSLDEYLNARARGGRT